MKVGVALPHYDFSFPDHRPSDIDSVVEVARAAEGLGYDSVWVSDHLFLDLGKYGGPTRRYGALEPLTTLSALAAETRRVRLGTLVLCEAFRPPTLLAKMAATLDVVSGGRLELGLGAGWYEPEFAAAGIPFPGSGERIARLGEAVRIVGGMLAGTPFTFEGRFYQALEAPNDPQPVQRPRPPIWVGGKGGPRLMRVVAEAADGWNVVWRMTPEAYDERLRVLAVACARAGRDPATVRLSIGLTCLVGGDREDLAARWRDAQRWAPGGLADGVTLEEYAEGALVGTPDECVARVKEFEARGVEHLILSFAPVPFAISDLGQLELFAAEVLPKLR